MVHTIFNYPGINNLQGASGYQVVTMVLFFDVFLRKKREKTGH